MDKGLKRTAAGITSAALLCAVAGSALAAEKDWGSYEITNDGYGYLTANFPAEYINDFILYENETSTAQQVEALMYTLSDSEKESLMKAEPGYWKGVARLGIPEIKEAEDGFPAPGIYAAAATFSEEAAAEYGSKAAEEIKAGNANMLYVSEEGWQGDAEGDGTGSLLVQNQIQAAAEAMSQNGVITGIRQLGGGDLADLSGEERDKAVTSLLKEIGTGGYLGMVQKSRDGKAAEDADAPDRIALALTGEDVSEAQVSLVKQSAVLLKNDGVLPLSDADVSAVDGAAQEVIAAGDAVIIYVTDAEASADFLDEQMAEAKDAGKKTVLVLAGEEPENIDAWAAEADAILEAWSPVDQEAEALTSLLTGETNPSGKLPADWPSETEETAWAFGYGLSYTAYSYEILSVSPAAEGDESYGYDVTVQVNNEADTAGRAVVQLYLSGLADTEYAEEIALAAYARTDIIEAGQSTQTVLHIGEDSLGSEDEAGEVRVTEGVRTLYASADSTDMGQGQKLEVKAAKAGASVEASVPDSITAGEAFDVTVSAPNHVISLQMKDADGNPYQPLDVLKENLGDSVTFVYTLQIDAAGPAQIIIYTTTTEGPEEEPADVLEIDVQ